ncbi:MAG: hypothetical protein VX520_01505, partial [Planctomycetota bacterium]|nr:hypothetical protein [Planctomycetota bacterium]
LVGSFFSVMSVEVKGCYTKPHPMPTSIPRSHRGRCPLVYGSQDVALRLRIGGFFDLGAMMCGPLRLSYERHNLF